MKCRCGHGRGWHRRPARSAHGNRTTLPCQFRMATMVIRGRSGGWARPGGKRNGGICKCRNYVEVPQQ